MIETSTASYSERLVEALPRVRDRIARAADACERAPDDILLVAVTKSHPVEAVEAALAAGLTHLGENRVEELEQKVGTLGRTVGTWHMIGHIQSRKAKTVSGLADLVHSVDTPKLARRLAVAASERGESQRVLLQVNTSGEASKSGFAGEGAVDAILELAELDGLDVAGLMTMAPFVDDEAVLGDAFAGLRRLLEVVRSQSPHVGPELSMGMTNDLEIAIREGSTMVRIGTALFGPRS